MAIYKYKGMSKIFLLCSIVVFISLACKQSKKNHNKTVSVDTLKYHKILSANTAKFDEIFEKVDEIQLETKKECFLGSYVELSVDLNGRFAVYDIMIGKTVYLFDKNGKYIVTVGKKGKGPGEYIDPLVVNFDGRGNIYTYDHTLLRINKYDNNGKYLGSSRVDKYFIDLEIDNENNIFCYSSTISDYKGSFDASIFKYNKKGEFVKKFCDQPDNFNPTTPCWGGGIVVDSSNYIYQMSPYEYKIQVFDNEGDFIASYNNVPDYYRSLSKPKRNLQKDMKSLASWADSWTHIRNLFLLEENFLVVYTTDTEGKKDIGRLNIYDLNGNPIKIGIDNPYTQCGNLFSAKGNYFYIPVAATNSENQKNNEVLNPKILKYRIRR